MGQVLSEPIREKHTESGSNDDSFYALSEMQGWRLTMEDAHTALLQLPNTDKKVGFFAVYDGHGGSKVAKFAGANLYARLTANESFQKGSYPAALTQTYFDIDQDLLKDPTLREDPSGCTAVSALITEQKIYCANAGDSRCILSVAGTAVALSEDHKPTGKAEQERIRMAGGFVDSGRVNGNLALSRALGDFEYKRNTNLPAQDQIVTANPEIKDHDLTDDVLFSVLACDGIWDCMTNQEVIDFVQARIASGKELTTICEEMMDFCLAPDAYMGGVGCDNMSVIIIAFLRGRTKEEWRKVCLSKLSATGAVQHQALAQTTTTTNTSQPSQSSADAGAA